MGTRRATLEDGEDLVLGDVVRFQGFSRLNRRLRPWDFPDKTTVVGHKALPAAGTTVTVVGETDSDFFNILLGDAVWKPAADGEVIPAELPSDIRPADIYRKSATSFRTTTPTARRRSPSRSASTC